MIKKMNPFSPVGFFYQLKDNVNAFNESLNEENRRHLNEGVRRIALGSFVMLSAFFISRHSFDVFVNDHQRTIGMILVASGGYHLVSKLVNRIGFFKNSKNEEYLRIREVAKPSLMLLSGLMVPKMATALDVFPGWVIRMPFLGYGYFQLLLGCFFSFSSFVSEESKDLVFDKSLRIRDVLQAFGERKKSNYNANAESVVAEIFGNQILSLSEEDPREKLLFLVAKDDHNAALSPHAGKFKRIFQDFNEHYDVKYKVISKDKNITEEIERASKIGKVAGVYLSAHSSPDEMFLSEREGGFRLLNRFSKLDVSQFSKMELDAPIILGGCCSGYKKRGGLAAYLAEISQRRVIAHPFRIRCAEVCFKERSFQVSFGSYERKVFGINNLDLTREFLPDGTYRLVNDTRLSRLFDKLVSWI